MANYTTKWTEEQINLLKQRWDSGESASDIARELGGGVSRCAVIGKARRLGLKYRGSGSVKRKHPRPRPRVPGSRRYRQNITRFLAIANERDPVFEEVTPVVDAEIPISQRCSLFDLDNHHCRWPVGEVGSPGFFFCGDPTADAANGRPYCRAHAARAFTAPAPRRHTQNRPDATRHYREEAA